MMKTLALTFLIGVGVTSALAHPSVVPHDHPHATSMLPDSLALLLSALVVGCGFFVLRRVRKD
jgi:drug/metabolite transporter (DMT)-like permease